MLSRRSLVNAVCPAVLLLVAFLASPAQLAAQNASVETLRERVLSFYSLLQAGQKARAAEFVAPEARQAFLEETSSPFLSFEIESLTVEPDGQNARVQMKLQMFGRFATGAVPVTLTNRWKRTDGEWLVLLEPAGRANPQALFTSGGEEKKAAPEELKFKANGFGLGVIRNNQIKTARFEFTNVTDHPVTMTVLTSSKSLKVKTEKMQYKPGESGELLIDFDPTGNEYEYRHTIVVKTEPGGARTFLHLIGYVVPSGSPAQKPAETREPARKPTVGSH